MTTPTFESRFVYHLPDYWTPEQALAILEFLDDLRQVIWAHYDLKVNRRGPRAAPPRS